MEQSTPNGSAERRPSLRLVSLLMGVGTFVGVGATSLYLNSDVTYSLLVGVLAGVGGGVTGAVVWYTDPWSQWE